MVPYPLGWTQDRRRRGLAPPRHEPPGSLGIRQPARGQKGEARGQPSFLPARWGAAGVNRAPCEAGLF